MSNPEPQRQLFTIREIITFILKQRGIRVGKWAISIEFGFGATMMDTAGEVLPTGMVGIKSIGIQPVDLTAEGPNIVDARIATSPLHLPDSLRDS